MFAFKFFPNSFPSLQREKNRLKIITNRQFITFVSQLHLILLVPNFICWICLKFWWVIGMSIDWAHVCFCVVKVRTDSKLSIIQSPYCFSMQIFSFVCFLVFFRFLLIKILSTQHIRSHMMWWLFGNCVSTIYVNKLPEIQANCVWVQMNQFASSVCVCDRTLSRTKKSERKV